MNVAETGLGHAADHVQPVVDVDDNAPDYEVAGMALMYTRRFRERRAHHVEIVADPYDIGTRVVGEDNGVRKGPIAVAGLPHRVQRKLHHISFDQDAIKSVSIPPSELTFALTLYQLRISDDDNPGCAISNVKPTILVFNAVFAASRITRRTTRTTECGQG